MAPYSVTNRQLPLGSVGIFPPRSTQSMIRSRISVLERATTGQSLNIA
jgi:hypothetical protein